MTQAQEDILKAAILADGNLAAFVSAENWGAITDYANSPAAPAFAVWQTRVPVQVIYDAIDWTKYTPADAADATVTFSNRVLVIQTKQMNLQNMLTGRDSIDASKPNLRAGLRDSVIQLPAGASGAMVTAAGASGVTLLTALTRGATYAEKWFAGGAATTGTVTASLLTFEGPITEREVLDAMRS